MFNILLGGRNRQILSRILNLCENQKPIISRWGQILPRYFATAALSEKFNNLTKNDPILEKKLQMLILEVDVYRQEGRNAPDPEFIKEDQWEHILSLETRSARKKYYSYLWHTEKKKENKLQKREQKKIEIADRKEMLEKENKENEHIIYGLNNNTFLLRVYDTTINFWHNNKLSRAMQFSPKLVLDCSYDEYMNQQESINAAKQLMLCFAENRMHDEPFDLHFCNFDQKSRTSKHLIKHIPTMLEPWFPLNVHEGSYMDLFPKEQLVYLTPHCRTEIHKYNPDDVYIIGAMVDKVNNEPLSLAKAKRQGLRMAKLPLDKYLQWSAGSGKSLTLNQMTNILLEVKQSNDWRKALQVVPRRKIVDERFQFTERKKLQDRLVKFQPKNSFNYNTKSQKSS